MRIYWYWPFARQEEMELARALPRPGDHLTLHTMHRPGAPASEDAADLTIVADLREIDPTLRAGTPRWAIDRTATYAHRAGQRARMIRRLRPELIHLHYLNFYTDGLDPTLARSAPLVVDVHDVYPHHHRLPVTVERRLIAREYRRVDHVVVHHRWVHDRLIDQFALDPARVSVIPLQVPPLRRTAARSSSPSLLMFGTLRANKGLPTLLAALALLDDPDLRLVIAGRGRPEVERLARDAAATDPRVRAELGWVSPERKAELFSDATHVVLPYSAFESQSAVLNDAYSMGLPVIATEVGALGETVREDGTGWVVPPDDVASLAAAIRGAVSDLSGSALRSAAASAIAAERSPLAVATSLRMLYDSVAA